MLGQLKFVKKVPVVFMRHLTDLKHLDKGPLSNPNLCQHDIFSVQKDSFHDVGSVNIWFWSGEKKIIMNKSWRSENLKREKA